MPCYTVRTISVEFKSKHVSVLEKAAKSLGYSWNLRNNVVTLRKAGTSISINLDDQQATFLPALQGKVNELKRTYSLESLKKAGLQAKWQVAKKTTTKLLLTKVR